jgi:hypothetical protein
MRALLPTLRRLHAAELVHLRAHAARLETRLTAMAERAERLEQEVWEAHGRADMFLDALNRAEDVQLGLTMSGDLLVAAAEAPSHG